MTLVTETAKKQQQQNEPTLPDMKTSTGMYSSCSCNKIGQRLQLQHALPSPAPALYSDSEQARDHPMEGFCCGFQVQIIWECQ